MAELIKNYEEMTPAQRADFRRQLEKIDALARYEDTREAPCTD